MKHINLFLMLCVLCIAVYGISACSKEENHKPDTDQSIPAPKPDPTPEPEPNNYTLQGTMQAAEQLVGKKYSEIHKYMRSKSGKTTRTLLQKPSVSKSTKTKRT